MNQRDRKRPLVVINAAMSVDGKISSTERGHLPISDEADLARVDRLRSEVDAIVIGGGTLRSDNPRLTIRSEELRRQRERSGRPGDPIKVVVTGTGDLPMDSSFLSAGEGGKFVFTTERADPGKVRALSERMRVFVVGRERVDFERMIDILAGCGVRRVMVEGGATLNFEMIEAGVVDEIHVTVSPVIIGGEDAPTLVDGRGFPPEEIRDLELISCERLGGSVLVKYRLCCTDRSRFVPAGAAGMEEMEE